MIIPEEWKNYARYKVDEILEEVKDICPINVPIPIKEVIESYVGDVQYVTKMDYVFPESTSALATKDMILGWIIVIDEKEPIVRQRFSAAHELAHIVLFKNQASTVYCSKDSHDWQEKLCDRFAGDILMPEKRIRGIYQSEQTPFIEDIMKTFKVSRPVAEIQLKRLNLPFKLKFG